MSRVDVLAVMRDAIRYETKTGSPEWVAELREARAAVADLIDAAEKARNDVGTPLSVRVDLREALARVRSDA